MKWRKDGWVEIVNMNWMCWKANIQEMTMGKVWWKCISEWFPSSDFYSLMLCFDFSKRISNDSPRWSRDEASGTLPCPNSWNANVGRNVRNGNDVLIRWHPSDSGILPSLHTSIMKVVVAIVTQTFRSSSIDWLNWISGGGKLPGVTAAVGRLNPYLWERW